MHVECKWVGAEADDRETTLFRHTGKRIPKAAKIDEICDAPVK